MSTANRLAILAVLALGSIAGYLAFDRTRQPVPPQPEPRVLRTDFADTREAERYRRAQRPSSDRSKEFGRFGRTYDEALNGWGEDRPPHPKPAEPRPPTSCRSVEPVPKDPDRVTGPHWVHDITISHFKSKSGFGYVRMFRLENKRGVDSYPAVDRVELVSLLTDDEPSVYVLDEMATPPLARQAQRRPLDEFERLGLDAVRRGENLVWTREAPTRMFGAIRARKDCRDCHMNAREGELLGAFTYYLDTPVDRLAKDRRR